MDTINSRARSRVMSSIGSRNTTPELLLRRGLHSRGFRYRLHVRDLPGTPDIVLPKFKTAIFVNGCFWHGHECSLFQWPKTRANFWRKKIESNSRRDIRVHSELMELGWRLLVVWECAMRGPNRIPEPELIEKTITWISGGSFPQAIDDVVDCPNLEELQLAIHDRSGVIRGDAS